VCKIDISHISVPELSCTLLNSKLDFPGTVSKLKYKALESMKASR